MSHAQKITAGESGVLAALSQEPSGRLTRAMACFLLQTTPQSVGRMVLSLSRKNLVHQDRDGTIYPNSPPK